MVLNTKEGARREIMAVDKGILFGNDYFEGFKPVNETDYLSRILKDFKWIERTVAEGSAKYKQPIAYSAIVNPSLKQVFIYQRSCRDAEYPEKRLQGKWSCGIGGHIEKYDIQAGNPIQISMLRELQEEISIAGSVKPKVLGYINDDSNEVGSVHFGILYIIETDSEAIEPKDSEIEKGGLKTLEELDEIYSSPDCTIEGWSRVILEPLKSYLGLAER